MCSSRTGAPPALRVIVVVGALLRFSYVTLYPQLDVCAQCANPPDWAMYDEVAHNLAAGKGFRGGFAARNYDVAAAVDPDTPEVGTGPLYPGFLALVYAAAGDHVIVVRLAQAAVSTVLLLPLFTVAAWTFDERIALVAVALAAVLPVFVIYSGLLLTETLSATLLVFAVLMIMRAWRRQTVYAWVAAGAITGVLIVLRAELAPLAAVAALVSWLRLPGRRTGWFLVAYACTIAAAMAPWTIRNYRTFHRFIPVAAHEGDTLWISVKGWREWRFDDPELRRLVAGRTFLEQQTAFHDAAMQEVAARPVHVAWTLTRRFPDFWFSGHSSYVRGFTDRITAYWHRGQPLRAAVKVLLLAINTALVALGIGGLIAACLNRRRRSPEMLLIAAPIVLVAAVHFVLFAAPRYHVPIMPFLLVFAADLLCRRMAPA